MKTLKKLAVLLIAVVMLTACGSGSNEYSRTYTKTGTSYYDDTGTEFYGDWTDRTTVTVSPDKTQVHIFQEETYNGNAPFVHEVIYTFSKPVVKVSFVENYNTIDPKYDDSCYGMVIAVSEKTMVSAKVCEVNKSQWTENSAERRPITLMNDRGMGEYNFFEFVQGDQYRVLPVSYDPAVATVVTYIYTK